jgi:protein-S-isoprenylcysteine O-methyltransferase Ste14
MKLFKQIQFYIKMGRFKSYFGNLAILWFAMLIYFIVPFYSDFLGLNTKTALLVYAIGYTFIGFVFYTFHRHSSSSKGLLILRYFRRLFLSLKNKEIFKPEPEEKNALLFGMVKFFFFPIMLNFVFSNFSFLISSIPKIGVKSFTTIGGFNTTLFPVLLTAIFFFDTLVFTFGYAFESILLKNKLRSVEPTIFGWAVALICYPPFNGIFGKFLHWSANDYFSFNNEIYTFILRIFIVLLLSIYLSATFALGTKSSNLTNRGIVSRGPYAIIRHPAYISKNLAWWITTIASGSIEGILTIAVWSFVYHLRAITEEKHLMLDSDYVEYCKRVRYRYIPGIY